MSRQLQYEGLAEVINPGESARLLLKNLKRDLPQVVSTIDEAIKSTRVHEFSGMLIVQGSDDINDATMLALFLNWIVESRLAVVPVSIVNQMSALAAKVFDYPEIRRNAISQFQSKKRKGHGHDDRITPDEREQAISRALKRKKSEDRSIVVRELANELGLDSKSASRILGRQGWPGTGGRPNNAD